MALFREPKGLEEILDPAELLKGGDELREMLRQRDLTISQQNEEIARLKAELEELRNRYEALEGL